MWFPFHGRKDRDNWALTTNNEIKSRFCNSFLDNFHVNFHDIFLTGSDGWGLMHLVLTSRQGCFQVDLAGLIIIQSCKSTWIDSLPLSGVQGLQVGLSSYWTSSYRKFLQDMMPLFLGALQFQIDHRAWICRICGNGILT